MSSEMDLTEEVQKLLDEDPNLDEDQADMLKAAACLLAAAAVKKANAKAGERRVLKVGVTDVRYVTLRHARPWVIHSYRNLKGRGVHKDDSKETSPLTEEEPVEKKIKLENSVPSESSETPNTSSITVSDPGPMVASQTQAGEALLVIDLDNTPMITDNVAESETSTTATTLRSSIAQLDYAEHDKNEKQHTNTQYDAPSNTQDKTLDDLTAGVNGNIRHSEDHVEQTPSTEHIHSDNVKATMADDESNISDNGEAIIADDTEAATVDNSEAAIVDDGDAAVVDNNEAAKAGGKGVSSLSADVDGAGVVDAKRRFNLRTERKRKYPHGDEETRDFHPAVSTYDKVRLIIQPWLKPEGTVNKPVLKMMLESVALSLMVKPGSSSSALFRRYVPYVQPMVLRNLTELLEDLGCVKRQHIRRKKVSLFSSPATPVIVDEAEEGDETLYVPTKACLFRLGQFGHEMYPNTKWPVSQEYG